MFCLRDNPVKIPPSVQPVALYAPLDWGLGHTTRSIPIIRELIHLGFRVVIAGNDTQRSLLQETFPDIEYEYLEGYQMRLGSSATSTRLRITAQVPKILLRIFRERQRAQILQQKYQAQLLISDNRYGFYSRNAPSIFITHQLHILSGMGSWVDRLLLKANRFFLGRFKACWIPDGEDPDHLAGALSRPLRQPPCNLVYLGALSRFESCATHTQKAKHILVLLSGPEPQRTLLENRIIAQSGGIDQTLIVVRGLPSPSRLPEKRGNILLYAHLDTATLKDLLCDARYVISRAGYTSLMDYAVLGCKPLLIPTPGQAEQEYLGRHAEARGWALSFQQDQFNLKEALEQAERFAFRRPAISGNSFRENMRWSLQLLGLIRPS